MARYAVLNNMQAAAVRKPSRLSNWPARALQKMWRALSIFMRVHRMLPKLLPSPSQGECASGC